MSARRSRIIQSIGICAVITVAASLGVLAPVAMAAPSNDLFANRAQLGNELPVNLTESNAGATWEEGEFISPEGFAAGHSIWWEWEAPRSEVVSIGSCGSDFTTKLGVFTGETFPPRRVAADSGPGCDAAQTFAAVAGTKYDIGVDGWSFYIPGSTPPPGEGTVALRIAAVPPPPNDDFADPAAIQQLIWELPDGSRKMLGSTSGGYNWGATSEPGEPVHVGGGGASVWYRFVAPGPGTVILSSQASGGEAHAVIAVYRGSAISALAPVAASQEAGRGVSFEATAGEEFRIAIDGLADAEGAPWMGNFELTLFEALPPGTSNASGAPELQAATGKPRPAAKPTAASAVPDPPQVKGRSVDSRARSARFRFVSATRGAGFRCSLDKAPFRRCASPYEVKGLKPGRHAFRVLTTLGGRISARPAVVHFTVRARHR
jgi:hypothetical protein